MDIRDFLSWPDLIKMDIEGHERQVILAMKSKDFEKFDLILEVGNKINRQIRFRAKKTIKDAATDLAIAFKRGTFKDPLKNELFYNIKRMQSLKIK